MAQVSPENAREKLLKRFPLEAPKVTLLLLKAPTQFSAWLQLKIVVRVLAELEKIVHAAHGAIHFGAGQKGRPTPKIIWAQHPQDRPKKN